MKEEREIEIQILFENPNLIIPERCQVCEEIITDNYDVIDGMHACCYNEWKKWTVEYSSIK